MPRPTLHRATDHSAGDHSAPDHSAGGRPDSTSPQDAVTTGAATHPGPPLDPASSAPVGPPPAPRPGRLLTAVLASFLSLAGTGMTAIAIPLLVLATTGSPARAGLVAFAEMAPYLAVQFLGGPLVDRIGLRRVITTGNLVAGAVVCLVPWLYVTRGTGIAVLCLLLAVAGAARGLADTAGGALVPRLAEADAVPMTQASGWNNTAQRAGGVLGSLLGGLLLTVSSASVVIVADGISFLVAAALFAVVAPRTVRAPGGAAVPTPRYRTLLAEGLRFLGSHRLVLGLTVISASTNVLAAALGGVLLQVWSVDRGVTAGTLGGLFAALGAGQVAGSLLASWWSDRMPRYRVLVWGFLLGGPPLFLAPALTGSGLVVGLVLAAGGVLLGLVNPVLGAVYYERIPDTLLPRVLGTIKAIAWVGVAVGPALAGLGVTALGVTPTLLVCAGAYLVLALLPVALPVYRQVDRSAAPPAAG